MECFLELLPPRRNSNQPLLNPSNPLDPNDPNGPNNPAQPPKATPQMDKIKATQAEIDKVTDQLHKNIEAIGERGEHLDHLKDRTGQ